MVCAHGPHGVPNRVNVPLVPDPGLACIFKTRYTSGKLELKMSKEHVNKQDNSAASEFVAELDLKMIKSNLENLEKYRDDITITNLEKLRKNGYELAQAVENDNAEFQIKLLIDQIRKLMHIGQITKDSLSGIRIDVQKNMRNFTIPACPGIMVHDIVTMCAANAVERLEQCTRTLYFSSDARAARADNIIGELTLYEAYSHFGEPIFLIHNGHGIFASAKGHAEHPDTTDGAEWLVLHLA